jgi:septum formation protein
MQFVLASASPARLATLRQAGLEPKVLVSGVDEATITAADIQDLVRRLAEAKADAVAGRVVAGTLVLGCDSLLELDGRALGKPSSPGQARERWRAMRGKQGTLYTGHCLIRTGPTGAQKARVTRTVSTEVFFADLGDEEIDTYVATGEPLEVAGAFTVDGLGGWFVERIDGDHHNVVGLSLPTLRNMLSELGVSISELWNATGPAP